MSEDFKKRIWTAKVIISFDECMFTILLHVCSVLTTINQYMLQERERAKDKPNFDLYVYVTLPLSSTLFCNPLYPAP